MTHHRVGVRAERVADCLLTFYQIYFKLTNMNNINKYQKILTNIITWYLSKEVTQRRKELELKVYIHRDPIYFQSIHSHL